MFYISSLKQDAPRVLFDMSPQVLNFDAFYPFIRKRNERTKLAADIVKASPRTGYRAAPRSVRRHAARAG